MLTNYGACVFLLKTEWEMSHIISHGFSLKLLFLIKKPHINMEKIELLVEALKKEEATWVRKSRWKSIQAVFGRFSIHWFSPFADIPEPSKNRGYLFSV